MECLLASDIQIAGYRGITEDKQKYRKNHGGNEMFFCLDYSKVVCYKEKVCLSIRSWY